MRIWLYVLHALQVLLLIGLAWAVATMRRPAPLAAPPITATLDAETRGALLELAGRLSDVEASCVWLPRSERLRATAVAPAPSKGGGAR